MVFSIDSTSSSIDKIKLKKGNGHYPYITRSKINNGIESFILSQELYSIDCGNCITIGLDTQTVFYQSNEFYTGQNIQILRNKEMNEWNAQFLIPLLHNTLGGLFWGGNGATLTRLKRSKIMLPVDENEKPDWPYMEQYVKINECKLIKNYISEMKSSCRV